jgi:hypothetical protein
MANNHNGVAAAAACLLDIKDEGQNPPIREGGRTVNLKLSNQLFSADNTMHRKSVLLMKI